MKRLTALLFLIVALCSLVAVVGCLSMEKRELLIQDITAARTFIEQTLPPGSTRNAMLARLTAVQTTEELLQVRAAVRAARVNAAASQPSAN